MAVTTSSLGSNSKKIVIEGETSPTNIISELDSVITSLGWTLVDTVSSGPRNTRVTKVFSAPNIDTPTPTTKYVILRYDFLNFKGYMTCCEAWNTETHVATNESWHGDRNFPFPLHYGKCALYIFATARYLVIMGAMRGKLGYWQGVFEVERGDMPDDDSSGAPCFGYTNAFIFGAPYGVISVKDSTSTSMEKLYHPFWPPRTRDGYTGFKAIKRFGLSIGGQSYPPPHSIIQYANNLSGTPGGITALDQIYMGLGHVFNTTTYAGNTNARMIVQPKLVSQTSDYFSFGKIYGIKVVNASPISNQLDTVTLPIGNNYLYDSAGSNNAHYVFSLGGGDPSNYSVYTTYARNSRSLVDKIDFTNSLKVAAQNLDGANASFYMFQDSVLVQGRYVYLPVSNSYASGVNANFVYKLDLDTFSLSKINLATGSICLSLVHDGESTLYGATTNGYIRIQTANNDNLIEVTDVGGNATIKGYNMCLVDDNYAYFAHRTRVTNTSLSVYTVNNHTLSNTINLSHAGATASISWMEVGNAENANTLYYGLGFPSTTFVTAAVVKYFPANNFIAANATYYAGGGGGMNPTGGIAYFNGEHIVAALASNAAIAAMPLGNNSVISTRPGLHTLANVQNIATILGATANVIASPYSGNSTLSTTIVGTFANAENWRFPKTAVYKGWRYAKSATHIGHDIKFIAGCTTSFYDSGTSNTLNTQYAVRVDGGFAGVIGGARGGDTGYSDRYLGVLMDDAVNLYYFNNLAGSSSLPGVCMYSGEMYFGTAAGASSSANTPYLPAVLIPS